MRPNLPTRIGVIEADHALRSAQALSYDVLLVANRAAGALGQPTPFEVVTIRPKQRLPRALAALVLPGTGAASLQEIEQQLRTDHGRWLVRLLARAHAAGVQLATSCGAVFFAAEAGVLDGRAATTSWFLAQTLATRYPSIRVDADRVLIESGACITGGAALAHAEVMLALVERLASPSLADHCASYLLLDRRRSQRPYVVLAALIAGDPKLARAEAWVRDHLAEHFSVGELARAVGLGERTFARRVHERCGLTPIRFVQRIRVDAARAMIEHGASFEAAAPRVGYGDATTLRRVFRAHARPASAARRAPATSDGPSRRART